MAVDNREDCYFFIHGGCTKGNLCQYRHSDAVLKTINVCTDWMNTKICNNENCELRHSTYHIAIPIIPQSDPRSSVACYWEQNGGCKKHHCPYKHKNSSFPAFRPPAPSIHSTFNPAAKTFVPRAPKVSHNQTLILNKSAPTSVQPTSVVRPEPITVNSKLSVRSVTEIPRPPKPSVNSSGIQIKNISNNTKVNDSGDSFKTQISFKSSKLTVSSQNAPTKSVFDRLSVKPEINKTREKTTAKKLTKNPSPKRPAAISPKDSFTEIKIKTLEEILKEKREKQAKQIEKPSLNSTVSTIFNDAIPQAPSVVQSDSPQDKKRPLEESAFDSKRFKADTPPSGDLEDFGSDFEGADFSDPGDNLLDIDLDGDLADI